MTAPEPSSPYLNARKRTLPDVCRDLVSRGVWSARACADCTFRSLCWTQGHCERDGRHAEAEDVHSPEQ